MQAGGLAVLSDVRCLSRRFMRAQMQFEDVGTMPARVLFSHSRVGAGAPFEPLGEASLAPSPEGAALHQCCLL